MRPNIHEYFMAIAEIAATRSVCLHRHVGAVLVKDNRLIATGYNGSPSGQPHCDVIKTCGKEHSEDHSRYCRAEGLHAEANAILSAAKLGIATDGTTLYCVYSPCLTCCNMIKNAGIIRVIYKHLYESWPHADNYLNNIVNIECVPLHMITD